jgi:hypothetical protein
MASISDLCRRQTFDARSRRPLSAADEARVGLAEAAIERVLDTQPSHYQPVACPTVDKSCNDDGSPYRPANVDHLRDVLSNAGYPDAIVRLARPVDPAPDGSIVFGVPIGTGCVIGDLDLYGLKSISAVGTLPDGHCLTTP